MRDETGLVRTVDRRDRHIDLVETAGRPGRTREVASWPLPTTSQAA
ncbi:hypothetical protein [Nocardia sp. NPDC051833]